MSRQCAYEENKCADLVYPGVYTPLSICCIDATELLAGGLRPAGVEEGEGHGTERLEEEVKAPTPGGFYTGHPGSTETGQSMQGK